MPEQVSNVFFFFFKAKRQIKPHEHTYKYICHFIISGQMVINIEDVNDNAPEFIYSDSVFGEFIFQSVLVCSYCWLLRF